MKRRQFFPCLAAAAAAGCRRAARSLRQIRVSALPHFMTAPIYLADELGFFRQGGLQVDIQPLPATTQMIPLLAAGRLDAAFAGAIPAAFNAVSKGAPIRIVASREQAVPGCIHEIHGNRKSYPQGLGDLRLLKGKRVSVTAPTSLSAFLLDVLLDSVLLKTSDVELLAMRQADSAGALVTGRIDAVVDKDLDFSSPDIVAGPTVADLIPGFQYSYIYFGRSLIQKNTDAGAAFLFAYLRGVREFQAGRTPRAFADLAIRGGIDVTLARSACRARLSPNGAVDASSVQRMIDWAVRKGFLAMRIDASALIDRRFIEEALRRLGRRERTDVT